MLGEVLAGRMKPGEVETFGRAHGFDLSGAVQWLARNAIRAPQVKGFHEPRTGSIQYVIVEPEPTSFGLSGRNPQPLASPDAFNPLVVDHPACRLESDDFIRKHTLSL